MTAILGLNAYHGDAAAALVIDGVLVAAAEEERFNRIKHCAGFPALAAAWCLADAGLTPGDLDAVAVGRDPRANLGAKLRRVALHGVKPSYLRARLGNAQKLGDIRSELATALDADVESLPQVSNVEHHLAHAASAFLVSPFDEAAILTVDGFGDFTSAMLAHGRGSRVEILDRVLFPHSLGILYTAVTQWLGFPYFGDEGKVMGLAPYGDPERFRGEIAAMVDLSGPLFRLDLDYFTHHRDGVDLTWENGTPTVGRLFSARMEQALGPARVKAEPLDDRHNDVAAALQAVLEDAYLHLVRTVRERTGSDNLCLAGGVALNAVANGRIRPEIGFDGLYVQPAAGDSGTAVGAAYHVWNGQLGRPRGFVMEHAYTGPEFSDEECAAIATAAGLTGCLLDDAALFPYVAGRIAAGDVVGWFQGRMEFGPRALGARSIVADPRNPRMKDILNERIKRREPFRPFAPSALAEKVGEWFDQDYSSPFMVLVYTTLPERRAQVPAVNHVDDTGRVQSVEARVAPRYYRLIEEFDRQTGVPIVLNTSFNENEPIVMTPQQAVDCFLKTRMDVLVLGNVVIEREKVSA